MSVCFWLLRITKCDPLNEQGLLRVNNYQENNVRKQKFLKVPKKAKFSLSKIYIYLFLWACLFMLIYTSFSNLLNIPR